MICGRTYEERRSAEQWFAWRPVRLDDGRLVWLDYVWRQWLGFGVDACYSYSVRRP